MVIGVIKKFLSESTEGKVRLYDVAHTHGTLKAAYSFEVSP